MNVEVHLLCEISGGSEIKFCSLVSDFISSINFLFSSKGQSHVKCDNPIKIQIWVTKQDQQQASKCSGGFWAILILASLWYLCTIQKRKEGHQYKSNTKIMFLWAPSLFWIKTMKGKKFNKSHWHWCCLHCSHTDIYNIKLETKHVKDSCCDVLQSSEYMLNFIPFSRSRQKLADRR